MTYLNTFQLSPDETWKLGDSLCCVLTEPGPSDKQFPTQLEVVEKIRVYVSM
jgi:hypothetical protein